MSKPISVFERMQCTRLHICAGDYTPGNNRDQHWKKVICMLWKQTKMDAYEVLSVKIELKAGIEIMVFLYQTSLVKLNSVWLCGRHAQLCTLGTVQVLQALFMLCVSENYYFLSSRSPNDFLNHFILFG